MRDHQIDGILLLAHEEYNMHYFLKAVKKCGAYEKFCSTVKGIGTLEQYLTGMHTLKEYTYNGEKNNHLYFFIFQKIVKG